MKAGNPADGSDAANYSPVVAALVERFADRLKLIVLFGSQSRGDARPGSDHDLFVVIESLPKDPLARRREVMAPFLSRLADLPERLSVIAKTPQELMSDLTPLLIDVCVDGIGLYGQAYFETLRNSVLHALSDSGLQRRRLAGTWMWMFPALTEKDWDLTWKGYRERR